MGTPHNEPVGPLPYEIHIGDRRDGTHRVIRTMSITEAGREYRRLIEEGHDAEVWMGELRLKNGGGRRFTSIGGDYEGVE